MHVIVAKNVKLSFFAQWLQILHSLYIQHINSNIKITQLENLGLCRIIDS